MILYGFKNLDEFKEHFGLRLLPDGRRARRNNILLSFLKSKSVIKWAHENDCLKILKVQNMTMLKSMCIEQCLWMGLKNSGSQCGKMYLKGREWRSPLYLTDDYDGMTRDGDSAAIRYVRFDTGRVFKMKAGKMYRHLILNTDFGKILPEQVLVWLCEELALEWSGYNVEPEYTLHVDKDFRAIYSSDRCASGFGSCMTDDCQYSFYSDSVDASAAYLEDSDGTIVARAIIFENVKETSSSKTYRLLERQYAKNGDDRLKLALVNKLVAEGYIDGYKRVGADCHNSRAFIGANGEDLSDKYFYIDCNLEARDTLSYQDSFKWYNINKNIAYNYGIIDYTHKLDTTEGNLEGPDNYDSWHECWTHNDIVEVFSGGESYMCDEERLDEFLLVNGDYYHEEDVSRCPYCGSYYIDGDGAHSEATGETYCCAACRENDEEVFCENNEGWIYIDYRAVRADEVSECPHCGDDFVIDEGYKSNITSETYCCGTCKMVAEQRYVILHKESPFALCRECHDFTLKSASVETVNGEYICRDCVRAAESIGEQLAI